MDTVQQKDGSMAPLNRVSQRSARRTKSKFGHPILLIQHLTDNNKRSIVDGLNAAFDVLIRESPTIYAFLDEKNAERNRFPDQIFLYDFSRVRLPSSPDYYHASYVDGLKQKKQFVLAQAPFNAATESDFHRLLAHLKPEVVIVLMKSDTPESKFMLPSGKGASKTQADVTLKVEEVDTAGKFETFSLSIAGGKSTAKTNVCFFSTWTEETKVPVDDMADFFALVHKKSGKANREAAKLVVCPSGAWRSGVWFMYDTECERMKSKGRIRFSESVRQLRYQRNSALDHLELFMGLVDALLLAARSIVG